MRFHISFYIPSFERVWHYHRRPRVGTNVSNHWFVVVSSVDAEVFETVDKIRLSIVDTKMICFGFVRFHRFARKRVGAVDFKFELML